jgi:cobyrinic acid a,c-diamide synthase
LSTGVLIAAPQSRSGKTTLTLGLIRALTNAGRAVKPGKSGPDYIDTAYLCAAARTPAINLDAFAMSPDRLCSLAQSDDFLIVEGAMGLFDGAPPDGRGSAADLAQILDLPVLLVLDCASTAQTIAAIASGIINHRPNLRFAGLILNRVGSARHETMLRDALAPISTPIIGAIPRHENLRRPSRHLGLIQAREDSDLETYLDSAAALVADNLDLSAIISQCRTPHAAPKTKRLPPLGQHIAIASDDAFAFTYTHMLDDWQQQGAQISLFSPLQDEPPAHDADAIFLPGGYPELHTAKLAHAATFATTMKRAAQSGTTIYGECGGYMTLGKTLTDAQGDTFTMLGLLDLHTSFAKRKLHLGYRHLDPINGPFTAPLAAHEFHYSTTLSQTGAPLFSARDAAGIEFGTMGLVSGSVSGSFAHIIDIRSDTP